MQKPIEVFVNEQGEIGVTGLMPEQTPEQLAVRKRLVTRYGHIKRKLLRNERLKHDLLELAASIATDEIEKKLRDGEKLSE